MPVTKNYFNNLIQNDKLFFKVGYKTGRTTDFAAVLQYAFQGFE